MKYSTHLFICLVVRAIYIKVVHSFDTDGFINANFKIYQPKRISKDHLIMRTAEYICVLIIERYMIQSRTGSEIHP